MAQTPQKYAKRQCQRATVHPNTVDLAWAAGFIEGEGTFSPLRVKQPNGVSRSYPRVVAYQNTFDPIAKLQAMFGGVVRKTKRQRGAGTAWTWCVNGARAVGVMFTLFSFMSPRRRQQMRASLAGGY